MIEEIELNTDTINWTNTDFSIECDGEVFEFPVIYVTQEIPVEWKVIVWGIEKATVKTHKQTLEEPAEYKSYYEFERVELKLMAGDVCLMSIHEFEDYEDSATIKEIVDSTELVSEG